MVQPSWSFKMAIAVLFSTGNYRQLWFEVFRSSHRYVNYYLLTQVENQQGRVMSHSKSPRSSSFLQQLNRTI